jgi:zinc D-Ala-D-Ala carboxypeptidase
MTGKLTTNFSLAELLNSPTATAKGIKEQFTPSEEVINNLTLLAKNVLQPLRDGIGRPLKITSGFRCERLNVAIGGSRTSEHCKGMAADIQLIVNGQNLSGLIYNKIIELKLNYTQMIWEFGNSEHPDWIHISYNKANLKKQNLKAVKENGKTKYYPI